MSNTPSQLAYATAAFRFVVQLENKPVGVFTECGLPTLDWEIEELKEGGLSYVHQLSGRRKATRLTLKNGISKDALWAWCADIMEGVIERKSITITLLDSLLKPVAVWQIHGAYPIKWAGPQLKSDDNSIALQSIEFACTELMVEFTASNTKASN